MGQKCKLEIFSDFRGEMPDINELLSNDVEPDFYFQCIEIDNDYIADWNKPSDRKNLCCVKFGKLFYSQDITLPQKGMDMRFKFIIKNKYRSHDKLVWTFQEMSSPRVVIKLQTDSSCDDMNVYLRINHPQVSEIINEHIGKKKHKDDIDIQTCKVEVEKLAFTINKNVLPYQGFEISWDSAENGKPLQNISCDTQKSCYDNK